MAAGLICGSFALTSAVMRKAGRCAMKGVCRAGERGGGILPCLCQKKARTGGGGRRRPHRYRSASPCGWRAVFFRFEFYRFPVGVGRDFPGRATKRRTADFRWRCRLGG
jgi:hypothetical protein